ncbi:MAG: Imm42 family immunity protein, partial [Isosphaeraceae bacterium]
MLIGVREDFAIECIHEPDYPNDRGWVYGRMCLWGRGVELGNLSEPACMLNVTEGQFQDCLGRLDELHDEFVDDLPDEAAFRLLDAALYLDNDRSNQQVHADALRYSKFNFLNNWGESFDGITAFLLKSGDHFRILYRLSCDTMGSIEVTRDGLVNAMLAFLEWMSIEKRAVPVAS